MYQWNCFEMGEKTGLYMKFIAFGRCTSIWKNVLSLQDSKLKLLIVLRLSPYI